MARDVSKAVVRKDFLILHVRLCVYVLNLETVPSQKRKKKDEFPFVFLNLFYPSLLQKQKWRIGLVHFPRRLITRRRASSGKTFANLKWEHAACSIDYRLLTLVLLCAHLGSWFQYARRHACPGLVSTKGKISLPFISFFLAWRKMAIFVEYPNILWKKFLDRISCLVSPNNDISTICCRLVIRSPPTFSTLSLCFFFTSLFPCTRIEWAQPPATLSSTLMRLDTQWHQNGWFNQCPLLLLNAHGARMTNQKIPNDNIFVPLRLAYRNLLCWLFPCSTSSACPNFHPRLVLLGVLSIMSLFLGSNVNCYPGWLETLFHAWGGNWLFLASTGAHEPVLFMDDPFSSWAHLIVKEAKLDSGKCKYAKEKHGS